MNKEDQKKVDSFIEEYKKLCKKHSMEVEAVLRVVKTRPVVAKK